MRMLILKNLYLLMAFGVGCSLIYVGSSAITSVGSMESRPTLLPPKELKFFTLGYTETVADVLWLRTIQDFDYCENRPAGIYDPRKFKCDRGWVYHMIETITELAPLFRTPYMTGALLLSVINNDISGASAIYDKAVIRFPHDWQVLYNAAYQALAEEKDESKAARLLQAAGREGAPPWTLSLAARLHQKSGQLEFAKSVLSDALENAQDEKQASYFQKRLDEVEAEIKKEPNH